MITLYETSHALVQTGGYRQGATTFVAQGRSDRRQQPQTSPVAWNPAGADYLDVEAVEVVPAAMTHPVVAPGRVEFAIHLYQSIANYSGPRAPILDVLA